MNCSDMQQVGGFTVREAYQYESLSLSQPHIRLFRLIQRSQDGMMRLEIKNDVHLQWSQSDRPQYAYRALSYEWGPPGNEKSVLINGRHLGVRQNLYLFLESLLDHHDGLKLGWLWADAICIDQSSISERNHQVQQMRTVYKSATQVLAWIGPSRNVEDGNVFHIMDTFGEDIYNKFLNGVDEVIATYQPSGPGGILASGPLFIALMELCRRTYWDRLWILQELLLASEAILFCGPFQTPLHRAPGIAGILPFVERFDQLNPIKAQPQIIEQAKNSSTIEVLYGLYGTWPIYREEIMFLIGECVLHDCELLHDRVYALLGLLHSPIDLEVNYQMPICKLFIDVIASASTSTLWTQCLSLVRCLNIELELSESGKDIRVLCPATYRCAESCSRNLTMKCRADVNEQTAIQTFQSYLYPRDPISADFTQAFEEYTANGGDRLSKHDNYHRPQDGRSRSLRLILVRGLAVASTLDASSLSPNMFLLFNGEIYVTTIIQTYDDKRTIYFYDPSHETWVFNWTSDPSPSTESFITWSTFSQLLPSAYLQSKVDEPHEVSSSEHRAALSKALRTLINKLHKYKH